MLDLGDVFSNGFEVKNAAGVLTTPASNTCTLTLPDGTTTVVTLTVPSTGLLRIDYPTVQEGHHSGVVATVNPDSRHAFEFDAVVSRAIVSLADARARLNFLSTVDDEELRFYLDSATDYVEGIVGPVVRRTVVDTLEPVGAGTMLFLDGPVISLTTVVAAYGTSGTYDVATMFLDGEAGIVRPAYGSRFLGPVTVTYVAGRTVVPAGVRDAALDYVKWAWESQRGASGGAFQGGDDEFAPGVPPTPPYKIGEKLRRYARVVLA